MILPSDLLALPGSPLQTALAVAIVVGLFAPRLLPPLGRLAGRLMRRELARRLGIDLPEPPPARHTRVDDVEVLQPDAPVTTLRAGREESLASGVGSEPAPRASPRPLWGAVIVVSAAVAVLLWYLLHPR